MSKLINKYIIILIGFYVFWLGVFPQLMSESIKVVCKNLSHNSDYKIEVVNPRVRTDILPVIRIYADKISVNSKTEVLNADVEHFKIKLRILPLFSGRLHINTLKMHSAILSADLKQEVELDKDFFNRLENTKISCDSFSVKKFEATLFQKDTKTPVVYSGENLCFKHKNRYISLQLNSRLSMDNKISDANIDLFLPKNNNIEKTLFDIDVVNLDISPFRIYFKHYLPKDLRELTGTININADKNELLTEFKNCAAYMNDPAQSIILPELLTVKSKFKITQQTILFNSINIESKNIHSDIEGKISDYFGKTMPTLDLNIRLNKSKVEDIVNLLPPFVVEDLNAYKLKKYKFYGDALANVSVKGRLPEPEVTGNIFVNNGILTKPIPNASAGATVKIKLIGKYLNFDVLVPAGGSEKVMVNGGVELYNIKYADLTVKSTEKVSLPTAEVVVNPLHEILNFIIGPVPILHVPEGTGNIDISVKGNKKNPHVWGSLNFNNASVMFREIPDLILTNAYATLTFNDQNAVFTTKSGLVNGKDFKINGICDLNGKFDFDVSSTNQPTEKMYKALQSATLIPDIQQMLPKVDKASGLLDLSIKVYGAVKFIEDLKFNENAFAKGEVTLNNNNFKVQGIDSNNTNGKIKFDPAGAEADISAIVSNAPMTVKAKVKNNIADLILNIPKLNPNFLLESQILKEKQYLPIISIFAKYKGDIKNIEYDKLDFNAKIIESAPKSSVKYSSGEISAINNRLNIKNLKGYIENSSNPFSANLRIDNAFSPNPDIDGEVSIHTSNVFVFNDILASGIFSKEFNNFIKDYELKKGALNINCRLTNNRANMDSDLSGISIVYIPLELPLEVLNGRLSIRNNVLKLNKINLLADSMPILVDGEIRDIFNKQIFDLYVNSKPQQAFIDKYINKNQIYPIKIRGDIVFWAKIKGTFNNYDLKTQINLSKDSSIYHFGATLGDIENAISLYIDSKIQGKNIRIKDFTYDKIIDSLSGKQTKFNLLKAWGGVELLKDDMIFKDLRIKTSQPTDARIFNIIFRKPNIKQGQFTSDLRINNKLSNPRVIGEFRLFETNIPFIDVTVKNIEMIFKEKNVEISAKGDIMGNDVKFEGVMKNKLSLPYHIEKAILYTKDFDLNRMITTMKTSQVDTASGPEKLENVELNMFTANNFTIKADNIELRNINATNFEANLNIDDKKGLDVKSFEFDIAQGKLDGRYQYNFKNYNMNLNLNAKNINANDITLALFDLKNQIYGDLTGTVNFSCNSEDFRTCMASLNGNTIFNVKGGRMPKLGSLEYLLKAGNLVKGGLTGLSINSVIDLITPLKTGDFSDIFGSITIADGLANDIEITTKGKDLSLFISGTYNFATENADMEVLGLLSRKISNMLGPIGNVSINTLFNVIPGIDLSKDSPTLDKINKIPGIELSSKAYRKFLAVIKGNINGDEYVTNFSWIN